MCSYSKSAQKKFSLPPQQLIRTFYSIPPFLRNSQYNSSFYATANQNVSWLFLKVV